MVRGTRLLPLHLASADVQAGVVLHDAQSVHSSVCGCGGSTAPPPLSTHSAPTHLSLLSGARATLPDHDSVRIATNRTASAQGLATDNAHWKKCFAICKCAYCWPQNRLQKFALAGPTSAHFWSPFWTPKWVPGMRIPGNHFGPREGGAGRPCQASISSVFLRLFYRRPSGRRAPERGAHASW